VPSTLNWDFLARRGGRAPVHRQRLLPPGNWRKRLDFGTGTFGDMGCHILDPVFSSLALTAPTSVRSEGGAPNDDSWDWRER